MLTRTGPALLVLISCVTSVYGKPPLEKAEVDRFVRPVTDGEWCQGIVVGLVGADGTAVYGYGRTKDAAGVPAPDGRTVFEIGSATKAFTGVLLADMAARGDVKLDDPVQKFLPATAKVPQAGPAPITLADLATHRSGLPRMPSNMEPADPTNPYADYTAERMYAFLNGLKAAGKPGEKYEYSNLGAGLLGHALALKAGKSYEALLTERVLRPLKMADTSIALNSDQRARLAPGHDADGNPAANWDIPTFAAAGALRSTADDMVKFVSANLGLTESELSAAFAESRRVRAGVDAGNDIGLGWHVSKRAKAVWHNGQTGGYHAYVGFVPGRKVGVVVLSNTASGLVDEVGVALVRRLLGEPAEPPKLRQTAKVNPVTYDALVGQYALTPQFVLSITREKDRLHLQATGQPRARLYPSSATEFFLKVVDARVTFDQPVDGRSPRLVLHQNGMELPGRRKE